jgi:uncharacterized protein YegP (UPF0339 family)
MPDSTKSDGVLARAYHDRIAEPTTDDEVRGYWIFALGVLAGVLGILLFALSTGPTTIRMAGIALSGVALTLLLVGPVIRLPLERRATGVTYAGAAITIGAVVWFLTVYPVNWRAQSIQIVGLYGVGVVLIAAGAVFVPLLSSHSGETRRAQEREAAAMEDEIEELQAERDRHRERIDDLETALDEREGTIESLEATVDQREETIESLEADVAEFERSLAQFELFEDKAGEYRWRLRHRNTNVIADSGEGYASKQKAQQGLASVRRNAYGAAVVQAPSTAPESDEEAEEPQPTVAPLPPEESRIDFELFEDKRGEYRWRLRHDNGEIMSDSGEGYTSKSEARRAIDRVRGYVGPAHYLRIDPTAFDVYRDAAGKWRWRLVHKNGNILADSGQGYSSRRNARDGVERVRKRAPGAEVDADDGHRFEVYEDSSGDHRWRLVSSNDKILADGGEGYSSRSAAEDAVDRVKGYAPESDVLDVGRAAFEVYEDSAGEWRWRLRHRNGEIMGDSGEGYAERNKAQDAIDAIKRNVPNAEAEEV